MKSLCFHIALLFSVFVSLATGAEVSEGLKSLTWKKFAQEISKDATFQTDVKKILPGLEAGRKAAVTKSISQVVAGKGYVITDTQVDNLMGNALRSKAKKYAVGATLDEVNDLSLEELLTLASAGDLPSATAAADDGKGKGEEVVRIFPSTDPASGMDAPSEGRVISSKTGSRIKMLPGLSDPTLVSLAPAQARGSYIRHADWKIRVAARPKDDSAGFDRASTFRLIKLEGGIVKFEASDRPGEFLMVEEDGNYSLSRDSVDLKRVTFRLMAK